MSPDWSCTVLVHNRTCCGKYRILQVLIDLCNSLSSVLDTENTRFSQYLLYKLYVHCTGCSTSYWTHCMYTVQGVPLHIGYIVCTLYRVFHFILHTLYVHYTGCSTSYWIQKIQGSPSIPYRYFTIVCDRVTFCKMKI